MAKFGFPQKSVDSEFASLFGGKVGVVNGYNHADNLLSWDMILKNHGYIST